MDWDNSGAPFNSSDSRFIVIVFVNPLLADSMRCSVFIGRYQTATIPRVTAFFLLYPRDLDRGAGLAQSQPLKGKWWSLRRRRRRIASKMAKRQTPVTICTVCGTVGYHSSLANEPCGRMYGHKRCHGVNLSALNLSDWAECPACKAEDGQTCARWQGVGWLFVRGRAWVMGN